MAAMGWRGWMGEWFLAPFVLPGERVRVQAEREKPGLLHAANGGNPGAVGRAAWPRPARYFGRCGGCHYQHAAYEFQLAAKRAILEEELRRLGKIEPPAEIAVIAGEPLGYRNRVQLHVKNGRLGYLEMRSHKLCAIDECPIASPKINQAIETLNGMLRIRVAADDPLARAIHRREQCAAER